MNLSNLSLSELQALQNKIAAEIKKRQREEVSKAREQVLAIAQRVGIPIEELLNAPAHMKGGKVAIRYRHPADPTLQWTGRGHQPKWVREWLAAGNTLEALRV